MFTGIIEDLGIVKSIDQESASKTIFITATKNTESIKPGDSVAVNGVCLTVTKLMDNVLVFNVMPNTEDDTLINSLTAGEIVNLERALTLQTPLGGHLVTGHVDCIGEIAALKQESNLFQIKITFPTNFENYVVKKGSVAIDGISLTIQSVESKGADAHQRLCSFTVGIIPHTLANSNLKNKQPGAKVHLEFDILAKYVEKMLSVNTKIPGSINKFMLG